MRPISPTRDGNSSALTGWAQVVVHRSRTVLVVGSLVTVFSALWGLSIFPHLSNSGFEDPGSDSVRAAKIQREVLGDRSLDIVVIYRHESLTAGDPAFRAAVHEVAERLSTDDVARVVPYYEDSAGQMVSGDRKSVQLWVSLVGGDIDAKMRSYDRVAPTLRAEGFESRLAGPYPAYSDINKSAARDLARAELISLPIVVLLALFIFGSFVAATLPAVIGLLSLLGALAVLRTIALVTEVSVFSVNVISLIGMGLAVDYSLFIISRFREETHRSGKLGGTRGEIMVRTLESAGRTVAVSALILAAALCSLLTFPQAFLRSIAYGGIAAVAVASITSLVVLPAMLALLGPRIERGRARWSRTRSHAVSIERAEMRWAAVGRWVLGRKGRVTGVVAASLAALAIPILGATWGGLDYRILPSSAPAHQAHAVLLDGFGPETSYADVVLVDASPDGAGAYVRRLRALSGISRVDTVARSSGTTLLRATWEGDAQSERSQGIVRELRRVDPGGGATAAVGGLTAETVDLIDSVRERFWWMAAVIVLVMSGILFRAFHSVMLPVKAIAMNVLSIGATLGVVRWVFQDGHGASLLGFTPTGFLEVTTPILLVVVLFGLSMDYEVFLLSRIREFHLEGKSNHDAIVLGMQKTGRIITSAALLLAVVIGAFATSGVVVMKMLGWGMLLGLLLDATIVRSMLVPATMGLMGRWNWWVPQLSSGWISSLSSERRR